MEGRPAGLPASKKEARRCKIPFLAEIIVTILNHGAVKKVPLCEKRGKSRFDCLCTIEFFHGHSVFRYFFR